MVKVNKIPAYKQKIINLFKKKDQSIFKIIEAIDIIQLDFIEKKSNIIEGYQQRIIEIKSNCLGNSNIIENAETYESKLESINNLDSFAEFNKISGELSQQLNALERERKKLYEDEKKPLKAAKDFQSLKKAIAEFIKKEMSAEAKLEILTSLFGDLK